MQNRNVSVGVFVISGLVLFGLGLFLIGDRRRAFGEHTEYYSEFADVAGLSNGAPVRVGGMDAGGVVDISVPDSPASRFRVKWRIPAKLRPMVRTDSVVTIDTEGVVGGTFLSVRPGSPRGSQAAALATIPSKEPAELAELLTNGQALLSDAHAMLQQVGGKLAGTLDTVNTTVANLDDITIGLKQGRGAAGMLLRDDALAKQIRQSVTSATTNIDSVVAGLKAGRGAAGMLLSDDALAGQIREAVKNVEQTTVDLNHASHQADALISDLNSQQMPQKASGAIDRLNDTAGQVQQMVSEINKPDRQGTTAAANIRQSITNANTASVNLAEGTEALKHNFLLRGFFRRRGYYNLDHISPDQYRKDRVFTSSANYRAWLPASELFEDAAGGQEALSAAGRALLDGALTDYGDAILDSPIVIEGYCGGAPANQLLRSRSRALLVRQYLQTQLQLDAGNLGIVPMKNSPPNGMGHATWDGICIVIIRKKSK